MSVSKKRYLGAVRALPALPRTVFLLHAGDDLPYGKIAERLAITVPAVECCLAEALYMIAIMLEGRTPRRWLREPIAEAEAQLRQRYRHYCEDRLREIGANASIPWDDDGDDGTIILRVLTHARSPTAVARLAFNQMSELHREAIARSQSPFTWELARAMLHACRDVIRPPLTFDEWLHDLSHPTPSRCWRGMESAAQ